MPNSAIDDCFAELEKMGRAIQKEQWNIVQQSAQNYSNLVLSMQQLPLVELPLSELQQLDILHRRYMRALSRRMETIKHDISCLDNGIGRLKQVSTLVDETPQNK